MSDEPHWVDIAISNLLRVERGAVTRGTIEFAGWRLDTCDPAEIVRRGVVQVMEGRRTFEHLSVEENLLTGAYVRRDAALALYASELPHAGVIVG